MIFNQLSPEKWRCCEPSKRGSHATQFNNCIRTREWQVHWMKVVPRFFALRDMSLSFDFFGGVDENISCQTKVSSWRRTLRYQGWQGRNRLSGRGIIFLRFPKLLPSMMRLVNKLVRSVKKSWPCFLVLRFSFGMARVLSFARSWPSGEISMSLIIWGFVSRAISGIWISNYWMIAISWSRKSGKNSSIWPLLIT